MKPFIYETTIIESDEIHPLLVVQVSSQVYYDGYPIFRVPLTRLGFYENHLNRDRFFLYSPVPQEHVVVNDISGDIREWFTERLDWIGQNLRSKWSFALTMVSALDGKITWSFEDPKEAVLFKLTF